jgi:hypothetical protein
MFLADREIEIIQRGTESYRKAPAHSTICTGGRSELAERRDRAALQRSNVFEHLTFACERD